MDDSHPFRSLSIGCPIPEIRLFQTLTLKLQGQGHGCGQRARSYNWPSIILTHFLFIKHQQTNNSADRAISKFDLETSKVKVMREVKGQGHILYPVSNQCTSFSFHINRTNHSWDMAKKGVWPWKNTSKITVFNRISPKSNQVITMTRATMLPRFVVIRWVILTFYCADKHILANGCHSRDLGSRSWKGHPVQFPRPIYSLCQISKV